MNNIKNVPEIRFKGCYDEDGNWIAFTHPWEQRKFGSLLEETRNKTIFEDEDTLLSCAIDGMYLNSELFSHFRGSSNIGYLKVKKNDLILSAQNLHLGNCNVNLRFEHGIISPAYKVYELVGCNPLFMQAWVKKDSTKDFFLKSSTEGASVCRKNIVWEELYKQELPVPSIEEQTKVGEYFSSLDHLITLHQRKVEIYKKLKKCMVQKMFPKDGKIVPEIRFPKFTDFWEQCELGCVLEEFSNKSTVEDEYTVLSSTNTGMEFRAGRVSGTSNLGYKIVEIDDLVVSPQNLWLGNININNLEKGLVSPSYKTFKLRNIDKEFFRPQLRTKKMLELYEQASVQGASVVRRNLDMDLFAQIELNIPMIDEQQKIGKYFSILDKLIAITQQKVDVYKKLKKCMLQKMFV